MGLRRQMAMLQLEELKSAYEYARNKYIQCPNWGEMKDFLRKDMDRAQMALTNYKK